MIPEQYHVHACTVLLFCDSVLRVLHSLCSPCSPDNPYHLPTLLLLSNPPFTLQSLCSLLQYFLNISHISILLYIPKNLERDCAPCSAFATQLLQKPTFSLSLLPVEHDIMRYKRTRVVAVVVNSLTSDTRGNFSEADLELGPCDLKTREQQPCRTVVQTAVHSPKMPHLEFLNSCTLQERYIIKLYKQFQ